MKEQLQVAMKAAMKAKQMNRLKTIRSLMSAIQYAELEGDVNPERMVAILKSEQKKRKEELDFNQKAQRAEQVESIEEELAVIEEFLPRQMTKEEIEAFVGEHVQEGATLGQLMALLKANYPGSYDGKLASQVIREKLG